ncbi:MAG: hypothetical protein WC769_01615 [Thermodesulfovibrionales bacterium]|jgi:hypothetical protein
MQISIGINGLDELLKKLDPKNIHQALKSTLNKSAKTGKTIISSHIRERFAIKKEDLDKKIEVELKGLDNLEAKLVITGEPINLMHFDPKQSKKGGVNVTIVKKKKAHLKHAWIGHGKGGTPLVLRRVPGTKSKRYYSVKTKKGGFQIRSRETEKLAAYKVVTFASIVRNPFVYKSVEARIMEQMKKNWDSQMQRFGKD